MRSDHVARAFDGVYGVEDVWWFTALPKAERDGVAPFCIPRFHRTLGDWVRMVLGAGFAIEALGEPCPDDDLARAVPLVADAAVAPLFLHMRARKPVA